MTEILRTSEMMGWTMSVWGGNPIGRTLNCDGCKYLGIIVDDEIDSEKEEEGCLWGEAWKRLVSPKRLRRCIKINKEPRSNWKFYQERQLRQKR